MRCCCRSRRSRTRRAGPETPCRRARHPQLHHRSARPLSIRRRACRGLLPLFFATTTTTTTTTTTNNVVWHGQRLTHFRLRTNSRSRKFATVVNLCAFDPGRSVGRFSRRSLEPSRSRKGSLFFGAVRAVQIRSSHTWTRQIIVFSRAACKLSCQVPQGVRLTSLCQQRNAGPNKKAVSISGATYVGPQNTSM